MEKREIIGSLLLIIILSGGLLAMAWVSFSYIKKTTSVKLDIENLRDTDFGDVEAFLLLSQRFAAAHEYDLAHYNCVNYSRDLKEVADQLGFKVWVVDGFPDNGSINQTGHSWLRLMVDFEPQTGRFIDYSKKYPKQTEQKP